jgi:hypothetical protein
VQSMASLASTSYGSTPEDIAKEEPDRCVCDGLCAWVLCCVFLGGGTWAVVRACMCSCTCYVVLCPATRGDLGRSTTATEVCQDAA